MISRQLPLQIWLNDSVDFNGFYAGPNAEIVSHIKRLSQHRDEPCVYLYGPDSSGKSHLLQAAAHAVAQKGRQVVYIPLQQVKELDVAILEGLDQSALVCLDDVDHVAGNTAWEEALFHLYNELREANVPLLLSAAVKPDQLGLQLMDLQSRLNWGLMLQLKVLADDDKIQAIRHKARLRGLELGDDVCQFIMRRCPRDMLSLSTLLQGLDQACMAAKRKPTVPFVKALLDELDPLV